MTFSAAGHLWRLTYAGGDGNEVILTAEGPAPELTVTAFTLSAPPEGAAGRQITATLNGPATTLINLEASDDLQVWNIIGSETTNSAGTASFNTTDSSAGPRRFYQFRIP